MSISKFAIAGVLALGLGLATSGTADAQWGPRHGHHRPGWGYPGPVIVKPVPVVVQRPVIVNPGFYPPGYMYGRPVYGPGWGYPRNTWGNNWNNFGPRPGFSIGFNVWR